MICYRPDLARFAPVSVSWRAALLTAGMVMALTMLKAAEAPVYPPVKFPDTSPWSRNLQRTMRLLATSTPEQRHTVRILFYGQSITEQKWAKLVEEDLRRRFPSPPRRPRTIRVPSAAVWTWAKANPPRRAKCWAPRLTLAWLNF